MLHLPRQEDSKSVDHILEYLKVGLCPDQQPENELVGFISDNTRISVHALSFSLMFTAPAWIPKQVD